MRLGTSGLGVIAVVSLLVTAAAERGDVGGTDRESGVDNSRSGTGSERTLTTRYSRLSQVATETSSSSSSSSGSRISTTTTSSIGSGFVKIEFESLGSTSPEASRRLRRPALQPRDPEIPTTLARFPTEFPTSRRALAEPRNFARAAKPPDVRSANSSPGTTLEGGDAGGPEVDSSVTVAVSASRDLEEKLVDPILPSSRRRRRGGRETTSKRSEERDDRDVGRPATSGTIDGTTANTTTAESAGTMNHRVTTMTTRRRLPDANFLDPIERRDGETARGTRESSRNKETTGAREGSEPHFRDGQGELDGVFKSTERTRGTSGEANDAPRLESRYLANYSAPLDPAVHSGVENSDGGGGSQRGQGEAAAKRSTAVRDTGESENRQPEEFSMGGKTLKKVETLGTLSESENHRTQEFVLDGKTLRKLDTLGTLSKMENHQPQKFVLDEKNPKKLDTLGALSESENHQPQKFVLDEKNPKKLDTLGALSKTENLQPQKFVLDEKNPKKLDTLGALSKTENHQPQQFVLDGKTLRKLDTLSSLSKPENHQTLRNLDAGLVALSDDSLVRDASTIEQAPTVKSTIDVPARRPETLGYPGVTEEIARAGEITSESSPGMATIERPLRLPGDTTNTSGVDVTALLDNHKAARVRSFQTVRSEQQQQQPGPSSLESPSHPARSPHGIHVKDSVDAKDVITGPGIERPANQLAIPKSAYPVAKNSSNPSSNLLEGKPRKKYYEIKPSLITETDRGASLEVTTTPRRSFDKFLLPSVPSAFGKFGPFFLDEEDRRNVTERIGNTVQLDCRIGMLGHRKVTWLQHYKDSFRLLTVERESYSVDRRISLNFQYPDNWRLQIAYASLRDSGLYKCQVEIDQDRSLVKRYNVIITAPTLTITDDSGRPVSGERHLKAGSALKLRCEARDVIQRLNESVLWMRGDATLTQDVSENRTVEIANEKEINVVVSTLLVEGATPKHAGNYSCVVPEKARTTIAVHVLNGELPAAVQHNSGVSTAVLNLWVIHLTASYGFFR